MLLKSKLLYHSALSDWSNQASSRPVVDKVLTCVNQETEAQSTSLPESNDQTSLHKKMSNPGHQWGLLIQGWNVQDLIFFPIKDCCSRTEKKLQRKDISCLLCNSVSGKQCIWRLQVKLKAYLSPKAKHKIDFHCRQIKKQRAMHLQGIVWDTPKRTTCLFIHSPHLISCHLAILFIKEENRFLAFFGGDTTASLCAHFFLFNAYCQWVGASITH